MIKSYYIPLCIPKHLLYLIFFSFSTLISAQTDSTKQEFFNDLEKNLRSDYLLCTGDSAARTLDELITWRRSIDSAIAAADYPMIVRKFTEETGIPAADARPCEVVRWMQKMEEQLRETSSFLTEARTRATQRRNDSLFLMKELESVKRASYDLAEIPFNLSQRAFRIMARRNRLSITDEGSVLRCDSVPLGMFAFKAAFHFSRDGRYWCYEIESPTCSPDSLDTWARPMMDYIAAFLETRSSVPPDHIYRIGQLDIVPGRLAICKLWSFHLATAYVGLARTKNRFYAKAIVRGQ